MRALVVVIACARIAAAQDAPAPAPVPPAPAPETGPPTPADPAIVLREANAAATGGDWAKVAGFVDPLLERGLEPQDLAEAHRLAGLAAYFNNHQADAERHFLAYLHADLDGHLDPALYPPEVINFFNDVRVRHAAELRALRPQPKRYLLLNLVPPVGQFQNGDRVKGIIVGGLLTSLLAANVTTYFVIRSWCHNPGSTCDDSGADHFRRAQQLSTINVLTGIGFVATYVYGVWDGVRGYRRHTLSAYAAPSSEGGVIGLVGSF
jgi:hypothetical protein